MELRPTHTIVMSHQPTIDFLSYQSHANIHSNQPIMIHVLYFILIKQISFSFNLIQHTWHHASCVYGKTLYQAGKQPHQRINQN